MEFELGGLIKLGKTASSRFLVPSSLCSEISIGLNTLLHLILSIIFIVQVDKNR